MNTHLSFCGISQIVLATISFCSSVSEVDYSWEDSSGELPETSAAERARPVDWSSGSDNWALDAWSGEDTFEVYMQADRHRLSGSVAVGSPPIQLAAFFDLESPVSWATDHRCRYASGVTCFAQAHKYDRSLSRSQRALNRRMHYERGDALASGVFVQDVMVLGNKQYSSYPLVTTLGVATYLSRSFESWKIDAVVGLSPPNFTINAYYEPSILQKYIASNLFRRPVFTVWINSFEPINRTKIAGSITFGGLNTNKCGRIIESTETVRNDSWTITLSNATINGLIIQRRIRALPDFNTPFLWLPPRHYRQFRQRSHTNLTRVIRCSRAKMLHLQLSVGQFTVTFHSKQLLVPLGGGKCRLRVKPLDKARRQPNEAWVLGRVFYRKACVIFNYMKQRVAFARIRL